MGDLNIHFLNPDSTGTIKLVSLINNSDLIQIIDKPTRMMRDSESLIDIILCISKNLVLDCHDNVELRCNTDHMLVYCSLVFVADRPKPKHIVYRNYSDFVLADFDRDASCVAWNDINAIADINVRANTLNNMISALFDKHAPLRIVKTARRNQPYITYNIKKMIGLKRKAFQRYLKDKSLVKRQYYVELRNYIKNAITC